MDWSGMIKAVKAHASEHWNEDGWDVIVEAYTDEEIEQQLVEGGLDGVPPTTEAEAIALMQEIAKLHDERRREVQSTVW